MNDEKIYIRKPEEVVAIQWNDDNWEDVVKFCTTKFCNIKKTDENTAMMKEFISEYSVGKGTWFVKIKYEYESSDFIETFNDDESFYAFYTDKSKTINGRKL